MIYLASNRLVQVLFSSILLLFFFFFLLLFFPFVFVFTNLAYEISTIKSVRTCLNVLNFLSVFMFLSCSLALSYTLAHAHRHALLRIRSLIRARTSARTPSTPSSSASIFLPFYFSFFFPRPLPLRYSSFRSPRAFSFLASTPASLLLFFLFWVM